MSRRRLLEFVAGSGAVALWGAVPSSVSAATASDPGDVKWTFAAGGAIHSSPTVVDGSVYVGSRDNQVYALDAATGNREWTHETGGPVGHSSPTVAGGTVFVGSV
ncbi:outer membrane protein assembly factor BamB family protein [Natrialbaceae archaeon A-gly3]